MFKPLKKRNDNFVKRDFFAVKKTKQKRYAIVGGKIEGVNCFIVDNSIENLPTPNQVFFFLTQKNKPSSFFIDEIAKRERVIECVMIVSKLSQRFANELKAKYCIRFGVSNSLSESPVFNPEYMKHIPNNHSKMMVVRTDQNYYSIEGSGNPSINARCEFYLFSNNKQVYDSIKAIYDNA